MFIYFIETSLITICDDCNSVTNTDTFTSDKNDELARGKSYKASQQNVEFVQQVRNYALPCPSIRGT